ncbi:structure-specific endonuclease subunit SLX1 homolog isoform X2 [Halichondria panicea]|uniref:structure-specific endonuclease subunit SLX1 homolog isoform X2 n=1 Tax=Halichondria panicea TaxID=6063 RepID=UPI00312B3B24
MSISTKSVNSVNLFTLLQDEMEDSDPSVDTGSSSDETECSDTTDPDSHIHTKGEFFGCYLLVSKNEKFKGRTYIGFTVDPNRRIKQHNGGHHMGGARRTSGKGPWEMVLIIHGFPSDIAALRFEWAWQHPAKSRRLGKGVVKRRSKESPLQFRFRVVTEMLSVGPWHRLPLTIRWLKQDYELPFPVTKQPPVHMPIAYGLVDISKPGKTQPAVCLTSDPESNDNNEESIESCEVCGSSSKTSPAGPGVSCYHSGCMMWAHTTCLGPTLCGGEGNQLLPISGDCPRCGQLLLWGEMVRQLKSRLATKPTKPTHKKQDPPSQPPPAKRRKTKHPPPQGEGSRDHWTHLLHV